MRQRLLAFASALLLLQAFISCKSAPSKWQTEPSESRSSAESPSIAWKTVPLGSGNMDIYLMVRDQPYLIEKAASALRPMPRSDFARHDIPRNVHSAAYFWGTEASEDEGQKMYVRDKGDRVIIYADNLVPTVGEDGEEVGWTIKRTIRYSAPPKEDQEGHKTPSPKRNADESYPSP